MTGVGVAGVPDSHSESDSAFISLSPIPDTVPPRYESIPVGFELADQTGGDWLMEEGNGNTGLALTAEDGKNLVEVQVGVEPGSVTRLIEDLRVGVEPIVEAQNVEGKAVHTCRWPTPLTSRCTPRIRVKYSGKRNAEVKELMGKDEEEVVSKPKRTRTDNVLVNWLKVKVKVWEKEDNIPSLFETGESSRTPSRVSILGEPVEHTIITLVTRCTQYENQISVLKKKVGVLDEVDEATNERLKMYDEERVMQEHTFF
ncbi:hypothetical protein QVD17_28769 [Tagetes erecta]|uniref:Uncharacterized protein n=1 Tax=Tagetes erecta TaxID=13708 RepID=A0AAD8KDF5_TARER|nr:hypothetical protein QVD17_28769 [Tagetes erecta]